MEHACAFLSLSLPSPLAVCVCLYKEKCTFLLFIRFVSFAVIIILWLMFGYVMAVIENIQLAACTSDSNISILFISIIIFSYSACSFSFLSWNIVNVQHVWTVSSSRNRVEKRDWKCIFSIRKLQIDTFVSIAQTLSSISTKQHDQTRSKFSAIWYQNISIEPRIAIQDVQSDCCMRK